MTISTPYSPVQYTGNGVTTTFAFPYKFFLSTDLIVYLGTTVQSTGYTVTGGNGDVGSITFSVAPTNGTLVTIELSLPYTQLDDYVENQAFPAETLEQGFDRAAIRDQQLKALVDKSLKFSPTASGALVGLLPQPEIGKLLSWSSATGDISNVSVSDVSETLNTVITSPVSGQVLQWNGTNWVNANQSSSPSITVSTITASTTAGIDIRNQAASTIVTFGASNTTNAAFVGNISMRGTLSIAGNSTTAGTIVLGEDTDNGSNTLTLKPPAAMAANRDVVFPDKSGTIAMTSDIPASSAKPLTTTAIIDQTGSQTLINGTNVASISDQGTGVTRITFTTAYPDTNYNVMCSALQNDGVHYLHAGIWKSGGTLRKTTTYVDICCFYASSAYTDSEYLDVCIFGATV